jgi:hypothetical protein
MHEGVSSLTGCDTAHIFDDTLRNIVPVSLTMPKLGRPKSSRILKEQISVFASPSQNKLQEATTEANSSVAYNITMGNEPFPDSKKAYVEA